MSAEKLGKYQNLELIGSGATADVYRARDSVLERQVALKVLKPALVVDGSAFQRFVQEARAAATLFHTHIATVLEIDQIEGRYFIDQEQVVNTELDTLISAIGKSIGTETDIPVVIRADRHTPYESVVRAMDATAQLGLVKMSLATSRPASDGE